MKVTPVTRATAISTVTSASIWILTTLNPTSPQPAPGASQASSTYRITGRSAGKEVYARKAAIQAADEHAAHFLDARIAQISKLADVLDRPPLVLSPYDAELFGHWWYEGPEFLDCLVRKACSGQTVLTLITPQEYLRRHPTNQVATPAASSWGEDGYWRVWLNEQNEWILPHLDVAQKRMTEMAQRFTQASDAPADGGQSPPVPSRNAPSNRLPVNSSSPRPVIGPSSSAPEQARTMPASA